VRQGGPGDWALPSWNYSDSDNPNARLVRVGVTAPGVVFELHNAAGAVVSFMLGDVLDTSAPILGYIYEDIADPLATAGLAMVEEAIGVTFPQPPDRRVHRLLAQRLRPAVVHEGRSAADVGIGRSRPCRQRHSNMPDRATGALPVVRTLRPTNRTVGNRLRRYHFENRLVGGATL
jgi:hypothetical protein